jgi:hypothetical protein
MQPDRNYMDHKNAVPALSSVVLQNTISLASGVGRLSRANDEHGLKNREGRDLRNCSGTRN